VPTAISPKRSTALLSFRVRNIVVEVRFRGSHCDRCRNLREYRGQRPLSEQVTINGAKAVARDLATALEKLAD
jgi:hypothetical protein